MADLFPITVRPSNPEDLERLIDVGTASCLSSIDQLPEFRDRKHEMRPAFAAFIERDLPRILVTEAGEEIVGFTNPDTATGEICDLWIDPAQQGKGLGGILLGAAEAQLKTAGHHCTWLTTHAANTNALRFYRAQGYALLGISDAQGHTLPDSVYPKALMGKQLSRPDAQAAGTLADVRAGIDMLDPMILSLLVERFALIDRAAELKPGIGAPAHIASRIEEVVGNARQQAENLRFDPDLTETLWRTMVDLAVEREEARMAPRTTYSTDEQQELAS